jgi:outer membrane lipoprotein-sorting protein
MNLSRRFTGFRGRFRVGVFAATCAVLALFTSLSSTANAQSAEKILKQATRATGGDKAIKKVRSWAATGTITRSRDGASGSFRTIAVQPNLYAVQYDLGGLERSWVYNGRSGWTRDSRVGLSTLTGDASRDFQLEAAFRNYRWLNYKNDKSKVSFSGQSAIAGVPVNTVTLTTVKNAKLKMYFDGRSGLLVRDEIRSGGTTRTTDYSDYRAVDGVMEPFHLVIADGEDEYTVALNGVLHNGAVDRTLFELPKVANEPLPDIPTLLASVTANQDHLEQVLENYTYTETTSERELNDRGVMTEKESETHELTFYKGVRIRRLIAKNHQPLSAAEQAKVDKGIAQSLEQLDKHLAQRVERARRDGRSPSDPDPDEHSNRVSLADILRASKLTNPRREVFGGRRVIVFDFEPEPTYKPRKDYEKLFGKTAGVIWVDDADRQIVRMEARLIDSFKVGGGLLASLQKGGMFTFEQQRVNDEIWLPTSIEVNFSVKVLLLKTVTGNQLITYGNYQRFNTAVDKAEINSPPAEPTPSPTPTP